jgi:hypothetical protein
MKITKRDVKDIKIEVWAVKGYPISVKTLKPLFKILGFASKNISKFNDVLCNQTSIPEDEFPLECLIPLFFTIKAHVSFHNFCFLTRSSDT